MDAVDEEQELELEHDEEPPEEDDEHDDAPDLESVADILTVTARWCYFGKEIHSVQPSSQEAAA